MASPPIIRHCALLIPAVLFFLALAIRMMVAWTWQFDGLYGQDAFAYFNQIISIEQQLLDQRWAPQDFFWPNGFPFLAALAMVLFGASTITVQVLNSALGAAVVVLVYLIGHDLMAISPAEISQRQVQGTGFVAGVASMVSGQLVLSSVVVMADMAALFWLALSAWILIRFVRSPSSWILVVAAAATGAAGVVTRWATMLAGPAFAVVTWMSLRKCNRRQLTLLTAFAVALLVVLPQLLISLSGKDGGLGGYFADWNPFNLLRRSFESKEGVSNYIFPNGVFYMAPLWHPSLLPPTVGMFALPGLLALWRRRHTSALLLLSLWLTVPYLFFIGIPHQNLRYCLTMWVPAVILAAIGVADVWQKSTRRYLVVILLLLSLLGSVSWNISRWGRFFGTHNQITAMARHLDHVLPSDAIILSFEATLTLDHYTDSEIFELYAMDSDDLQACTARGNPVWAVVNPEKIEAQWRGMTPWINLMWLRTNRRLTVVEEFAPWVVYSVHPLLPELQQP